MAQHILTLALFQMTNPLWELVLAPAGLLAIGWQAREIVGWAAAKCGHPGVACSHTDQGLLVIDDRLSGSVQVLHGCKQCGVRLHRQP